MVRSRVTWRYFLRYSRGAVGQMEDVLGFPEHGTIQTSKCLIPRLRLWRLQQRKNSLKFMCLPRFNGFTYCDTYVACCPLPRPISVIYGCPLPEDRQQKTYICILLAFSRWLLFFHSLLLRWHFWTTPHPPMGFCAGIKLRVTFRHESCGGLSHAYYSCK